MPTFHVMVVDDATGAPAWWGATGSVTDGRVVNEMIPQSFDAADSVRAWPLTAFAGGEGLYTVTVERVGFATWTATDQEVRRSGCFLVADPLEARLQRLP